MSLLYYLSYVAIALSFAFVTFSLASGLLYISELIEEHSRLSKSIGQRGIYIIIFAHFLLFATDSLPFTHIAFSVFCHIVYLQNFSKSWPVISLTSVSFIASCVLVVSDHFLWFYYFSRVVQEVHHQRIYQRSQQHVPTFSEIATFFATCVWLAPLFLFLSLSANDNAIPISSGNAPSSKQTPPSRVSLFKSMFSGIDLPRVRTRTSRRNSSEGIIAPHSPTTRSPVIQSSSRPSSPLSQSFSIPPPRSPRNDSFSLQSPPLRSATLRSRSTDGLGLSPQH